MTTMTRTRTLERNLQPEPCESSARIAGSSQWQPGWRNQLAAVWFTMIDSIAPTGYEDEKGFHYGPPVRFRN